VADALDAPIRYLGAADVERALPGVEQRLGLAERSMIALLGDADMPPKVAVHPRPRDSFAHAMPAYLRGPAADGSHDLLGIKWVTGAPDNRAAGLPALAATVLLSDPTTGRLRAILDGGPITAHRTAAVSGVALRRWLPEPSGERLRVALVGAGVQGHSHLPVLAHLLPGASLVVCDRHPDRAAELAARALDVGAFSEVRAEPEREAAVDGADVLLTMVSFGPERQGISAAALRVVPLIVAVDYDMCVPGDIARGAYTFAVDERRQFLATRTGDVFAGYPDPTTTLGEALLSADPPIAGGAGRPTVLVSHLGVGLADLVFADAIVKAAERLGLGTPLSPMMRSPGATGGTPGSDTS
jgi:ornithine cyclodeaminase/alanine dehydrogenase-like protein (mu-crystallin family)